VIFNYKYEIPLGFFLKPKVKMSSLVKRLKIDSGKSFIIQFEVGVALLQ